MLQQDAKPGTKVYWIDPDNGLCSKWSEVQENDEGAIILVDGTEALPMELFPYSSLVEAMEVCAVHFRLEGGFPISMKFDNCNAIDYRSILHMFTEDELNEIRTVFNKY